jgi:hypothetical protein
VLKERKLPELGRAKDIMNEVTLLQQLSHPNVVGIYRVGEVQGRPYIAYEFVEGDDLDRLRAAMPWMRVARIGLGLARGLGQSQSQQIAERRGALGGEVREVDPQSLAGDVGGRILGEEMHPRHQSVLGDDQFVALGDRHQGRVVQQAEPRRSGERREMAGDEIVFTSEAGHGLVI